MPAAHVIAVVGPTATGKTALSLALAERLDGEIVNADASQLYRHMDIGTAKATPAERAAIPHHQLDVLDIAHEASVAAYQKHARRDLDAILARGRTPLVVGGSGLYVRALLDALDIPPTDPIVRATWEQAAQDLGPQRLHDHLTSLDPAAGASIDVHNTRRVVRALEVIDLTGRPFSAGMPRRQHLRPTVTVGLRVPRPVLDTRIDARTDDMWHRGFVDEVAELAKYGLADTPTASRALGYAQILDHLAGRCTSDEAREATARATRRLVRRQESWFGADPRTTWIDPDRPDAVDTVMRLVDDARSHSTPTHPDPTPPRSADTGQ